MRQISPRVVSGMFTRCATPPAGRMAVPSRVRMDPPRVVVMPAYNAARTLLRTYREIPHDVVHHVILVDDVPADDTVAIAGLSP